MLKKLLTASCLLCLPAGVCNSAQILLNHDFESLPTHSANWTVGGSATVIDYSLGTNFFVPGVAPTADGPWGGQVVSNGGVAQGNVNQSVVVAPGVYNVSASALARVFDNGTELTQPSRARLELRADTTTLGVLAVIATVDLENNGSQFANDWTPWTLSETGTYQINVLSTLNVRMQIRADAQDGSWGQVVTDSFSLEAQFIPEPTSFGLALLGGVFSVVIPKRRQRLQ